MLRDLRKNESLQNKPCQTPQPLLNLSLMKNLAMEQGTAVRRIRISRHNPPEVSLWDCKKHQLSHQAAGPDPLILNLPDAKQPSAQSLVMSSWLSAPSPPIQLPWELSRTMVASWKQVFLSGNWGPELQAENPRHTWVPRPGNHVEEAVCSPGELPLGEEVLWAEAGKVDLGPGGEGKLHCDAPESILPLGTHSHVSEVRFSGMSFSSLLCNLSAKFQNVKSLGSFAALHP